MKPKFWIPMLMLAVVCALGLVYLAVNQQEQVGPSAIKHHQPNENQTALIKTNN